MASDSLVDDEVDAGLAFIREFNKYAQVRSAFWLKDSDSGRWHLYVLADGIDDSNFDLAYGEVLRIADRMADPKLDPFQVRMVRANDPIARDIERIQTSYRGAPPRRLPVYSMGGVGVDDSYVYRGPFDLQQNPSP